MSATACTSAIGLECTNPNHDHRMVEVPEQPHTDAGEAVCLGCPERLYYDAGTGTYYHTSPDAPECFLAGSAPLEAQVASKEGSR